MMRRLRYFSLTVLFVFLLGGCGYQVHRRSSLPFTQIYIAPIKNETLEPKLQDKLHIALTEEFVKQGFEISHSAPYKLTGTISRFHLYILSSKEDVAVAYRVTVQAVFNLIDSEGKIKATREVSGPFIVSFGSSENLASLLAAEQAAETEACRDIAMEVAGALIYR